VRRQDRVYRTRLFVRRHRASIATLALAIAGLVAGLWVAVAQAREARSETRRAGALRRFLMLELKRELREQVPTGPDGPTLGYMLDHGLREVDHNLAAEPEVAAEVFSIAGETFRMIGANERAVRALRGALARKRALYGEGDLRLRSARLDLGHALIESGNALEAGSLLDSLERETRGEGGLDRYDLVKMLGEQRRRAGDLAGAEAAYREALAILNALGRSRSPWGVDQRNRLATVLYLQGKYGESERLLGEVVTLAHEVAEAQVPIAWSRRGYARHRLGDLDGAELAYRHAGEGFAEERTIAAATWAVAYSSCGWGLLLAERGEGDAARAMLGRPEVAGADPDHPWTQGLGDPGIPCPALAAWARDDLDAFDRALAASRGALRAATWPDRDLLRAEMLLARGRAAEALPLCNAAVLAREANPDLQPWRRAEAHLLRGVTLCRLGRHAEGLPEVSRHAAVLRGRLPRHRFLPLAEDALRR
jgi:tetratricopeptide (TPR) repeat protein